MKFLYLIVLSQKFVLLQKSFENAQNQNELFKSNKILEEARMYSSKKEYDSAIKFFNELSAK